MSLPFLTVRGEKIITETGKEIHLNGVNFANWLLWEGGSLGIVNYAEKKLRKLMEMTIDKVRVRSFFDLILQHHTIRQDFFTAKSENLNVIRLPFHYRHAYNPYLWPYQAIRWAREAGIYVILDMHAAPGGQAPGYFADCVGRAKLWENPAYQAEFMGLWFAIATAFKDDPVVAGYELLNEPVAEDDDAVRNLYTETISRIREIDNRHIIFLDGNNYATDFRMFTPPLPDDKMVYVFHTYLESIPEIQDFLTESDIRAWRARYNLPLMCNEYHFRSEFSEFFAHQGIHHAPWIRQKLTDGWKHWIHSIDERLLEKCNFVEILEKIRHTSKGERKYWKIIMAAINESKDGLWIDMMADEIEKMSEDELTALTSGMRDRTGTQFVPESIRG
jgi:hypothetical protein